MGFATHAIALALGYALGNPEGRARLVAFRSRAGEAAKEASRRPEVKQVREKAWDLAGEAGVAARNKLTTRSRREAADSASAVSGLTTPSPAATPSSTTGTGTGTATSGTGTSGSPAHALPEPGTATYGDTVSDRSIPDPTIGTTDTDERLAGTTVAEDSKATVLGLDTPGTDRPEPRR